MCSKQENSGKTDNIIIETAEASAPETPDEIAENAEVAAETDGKDQGEDEGAYSLDKCLNCGTTLHGTYCHNCGQHITDHKMTVKSFILNYLDNAFFWDSQNIKTLRLLIGRPGYLTKEYLAGKFVSQVQPMKLSMFLVLVFLTLFVFFDSDKHINDAMHEITSSEYLLASIQMDAIAEDQELLEKIKTSPLDTVNLIIPINLIEKHPSIITPLQFVYDSKGESLDLIVATVPHTLIEEKVILPDEDNEYHFNPEIDDTAEELALFNAICDQLLSITLQYFPLFILLTAPILALSLRLVQRTRKRSYYTHFIFSMHYIAFVEVIIIVLYMLHHYLRVPLMLVNHLFTIFSCIYFTREFRLVYETTWFRSITKAILSNAIYYAICMAIFCVILFISTMIVICTLSLE